MSTLNPIFPPLFNPDLTLSVPFEKNKKRSDSLVKSLLYGIGTRWKERVTMLFSERNRAIAQYYDSENAGWYLYFHNSISLLGVSDVEDRI